jgi:type IV secretory pathway VirB10-like protein
MGKKLDKLVVRIQALEKAIAAMVTGKKAKKAVKKKPAKAKRAKVTPKKKKTTAKKPAPKRRARKAKSVTPPLPLAATL